MSSGLKQPRLSLSVRKGANKMRLEADPGRSSGGHDEVVFVLLPSAAWRAAKMERPLKSEFRAETDKDSIRHRLFSVPKRRSVRGDDHLCGCRKNVSHNGTLGALSWISLLRVARYSSKWLRNLPNAVRKEALALAADA
jgi:hypothetical protein